MNCEVDIHAHMFSKDLVDELVKNFCGVSEEKQTKFGLEKYLQFASELGIKYVVLMPPPYAGDPWKELFNNDQPRESTIVNHTLKVCTYNGKIIEIHEDPRYITNKTFLQMINGLKTKTEIKIIPAVIITPGIKPKKGEDDWEKVLGKYYSLGARIIKVYPTLDFDGVVSIAELAKKLGYNHVQIHTQVPPYLWDKVVESVIESSKILPTIAVHSFFPVIENSNVISKTIKSLRKINEEGDKVYFDFSGILYFSKGLFEYVTKSAGISEERILVGSDWPYPTFNNEHPFKVIWRSLSEEIQETLIKNAKRVING